MYWLAGGAQVDAEGRGGTRSRGGRDHGAMVTARACSMHQRQQHPSLLNIYARSCRACPIIVDAATCSLEATESYPSIFASSLPPSSTTHVLPSAPRAGIPSQHVRQRSVRFQPA